MEKHNGQITEYIVRKNGYNISDLARTLQINRRSCYNWFQQKDLGPANIRKIGLVIRHDFSKEFPEFFVPADFSILDRPNLLIHNRIYPDADEISKWKEKYQNLLLEFNSYLLFFESDEFIRKKSSKEQNKNSV